MSFSRTWLDLREPFDQAARDSGLLAAAAAYLGAAQQPLALDLGCGTGSMARAFGAAIPGLRWRLVDRDPVLLSNAAARVGGEPFESDLADVDGLPLDGARLVTASALLDLVSAEWIEAIAGRVTAARAGFYAVLSYNGRISWKPRLADDAASVAAFNLHQRRDKGLGVALGPEAVRRAVSVFQRLGYDVRTAPSPWQLGTADTALTAEFVTGVARSAAEAGMADATGWARARLAAGGTCTVGHVDMLALPDH